MASIAGPSDLRRSAQPAMTVDDSDSEGDDFFVVKRSHRPKVLPPPPPPESSEEDVTDDEEDDDADGKKKKKKRPKKKAPARKGIVVPDWTIPGHRKDKDGRGGSNPLKRGSTEDRSSRDRADVVEILSSDDESSPKRSRKDGKRPAGKKDISHLLEGPPPETAAEKAARQEKIRQRIQAMAGPPIETVEIDDSDVTRSSPAKSSPPPANREEIQIHVYMIADRKTMPEGASENAVKQFEKKRTFTTYKYGKMERVWYGLAERLHKEMEDIVLVHDNVRIFSLAQTPASLGIMDGSDLKGYMKDHWQRLKDEERRELAWLTNPNGPAESSQPEPSPSDANEQTTASPAPQRKIKICLRGAWGEVKLAVLESINFDILSKVYCSKRGKPETLAGKLSLSFDGDKLAPETTVGDVDLEDGDMIDVTVPK